MIIFAIKTQNLISTMKLDFFIEGSPKSRLNGLNWLQITCTHHLGQISPPKIFPYDCLFGINRSLKFGYLTAHFWNDQNQSIFLYFYHKIANTQKYHLGQPLMLLIWLIVDFQGAFRSPQHRNKNFEAFFSELGFIQATRKLINIQKMVIFAIKIQDLISTIKLDFFI